MISEKQHSPEGCTQRPPAAKRLSGLIPLRFCNTTEREVRDFSRAVMDFSMRAMSSSLRPQGDEALMLCVRKQCLQPVPAAPRANSIARVIAVMGSLLCLGAGVFQSQKL